MKRRITVLLVLVLVAAVSVIPASAARGHGALGMVYVSSQGLWFDTFVTADPLPMQGPFQKLEGGVTEFGPGDPGYLGGRWWIDNPEEGIVGQMDEADTFLLCPLLGPGYELPE